MPRSKTRSTTLFWTIPSPRPSRLPRLPHTSAVAHGRPMAHTSPLRMLQTGRSAPSLSLRVVRGTEISVWSAMKGPLK
ncbi:hypothetical protein IG631_16691 [Alternaria alternata]|nr:hypothetical protein IG631_16691 [Alternaria alternata]